MTVSDILERAADLIEPEGRWTQDEFVRNLSGACGDELGPWPRGKLCFCVLGAISRANHDQLVGEMTFAPVVQAMGLKFAHELARWNDAPGRTQAEVVAKLREAAAKAREAGQ